MDHFENKLKLRRLKWNILNLREKNENNLKLYVEKVYFSHINTHAKFRANQILLLFEP